MITTEISYNSRRGMWSVDVYQGGEWSHTAWFFTKDGAEIYSAEARLGG